MTDRTPPHSLDAETAVLGAVLLHNPALDEAAEFLSPADFYRDAHRRIYTHMLALAAHEEPIDFVTMQESLTRTDELDTIGGQFYLGKLIDGLPHATNIAHYAKIVREKAALRAVIAVTTQTLAAAYAAEDDSTAVVEAAQQGLFEIATHGDQRGFVSGQALASEVSAELEIIRTNHGPVTGVPSGLDDLDYLTAGFQKGDLILLAARPSVGKTALALGAAFHAASYAQRTVAIFSIEMRRIQLGLRLVGARAHIDVHRLRTGQFWDAEYPRVAQALCDIGEAKFYVDDMAGITVQQIRNRSRKLKATVGLDLIVIDYLQYLTSDKSENRNQEVAALSRGLKGIARDLDVPVLALSQLSRAPEIRSEKKPQLSDLRDSGALEQDSDVVIFIYREELHSDKPEARGVADLIVAKQRNGPIGTAQVCFEPHTATFRNLAKHREASA